MRLSKLPPTPEIDETNRVIIQCQKDLARQFFKSFPLLHLSYAVFTSSPHKPRALVSLECFWYVMWMPEGHSFTVSQKYTVKSAVENVRLPFLQRNYARLQLNPRLIQWFSQPMSIPMFHYEKYQLNSVHTCMQEESRKEHSPPPPLPTSWGHH